jgi:protein TonB
MSDENSEKTMLRYTDMIRQRIRDVMIYPHHARTQGIEGRSFVRFSIHSDGTLISVQLVRSSGHSMLDEEALSAIRRAAPFPTIPESIKKDQITFIQGLNFELK